MDEALAQFLTPRTVFLALVISILTTFGRRFVETAWPKLKKSADEMSPEATYSSLASRWWNQVVLYALPVILGASLGRQSLPYLFDLEALPSVGSRVFFGGVVGGFSGFVYKLVRQALKNKAGVTLPDDGDDA